MLDSGKQGPDLQPAALDDLTEQEICDSRGKGLSNDLGPTTLGGFKRLQDGGKFKKAWRKF